MGNENLFDFGMSFERQPNFRSRYLPTVASKGINGTFNAPTEDLHDVEAEGGGQEPEDINIFPWESDNSAGPLGRKRSRSHSLSQMSDVSMLMAPEEPMKRKPIIALPNIIGGSKWLTQNVIRMHPLRQQGQEASLVDQSDYCGNVHGLYQRHDLGRAVQETDRLSGVVLDTDQLWDPYTSPQITDTCPSLFNLSEHHSDPDLLNAPYESLEDSDIKDTQLQMSRLQHDNSSNTSLTEILGNDHLLWRMWQRRGSVAPRGEEDVTEMKAMFETDPDMKFSFGPGWDLDLSDISSGSNDDPMLQDTMDNRPPPQRKESRPITPISERRSYFSSSRTPSSSSSASASGRQTSDPKFQRRGSIMKRFTWGGRHNTVDNTGLDAARPDGRTMEVKKRRTLDDYEMLDREASNDDKSNEMLF